jgi:hypothetical protein
MTRKVKAAKRSEGGRAVQGGRAASAAIYDGDVVRLPLSNSPLYCTIDAADAPAALRSTWHLKRANTGSARVARGTTRNGKKVHVLLARELLDAPPGIYVDHINGDPLDNRRCNLRLATPLQNMQNTGPRKHNTSGFKGVKRQRGRDRWRATICVEKREISLGYYETREAAARAYDNAARLHFGAFARLNFPEGT